MGAQVEALVDVGARVTNIVVHQGGVPRFVRILLMGGQDVTDAVAERMGVPQQQAEAMKQQLVSAWRPREWTSRPPAGSSRRSERPSWTRSAAPSTTTSRPAGRRPSPGSSSPAAERASVASPSGCRSPPASRSRSAPPCTACRSDAPVSRLSRSPSSSRWPPCRRPGPRSGIMSTLTTTRIATCRGSTCCRRRSRSSAGSASVQVGLGAGVVRPWAPSVPSPCWPGQVGAPRTTRRQQGQADRASGQGRRVRRGSSHQRARSRPPVRSSSWRWARRSAGRSS